MRRRYAYGLALVFAVGLVGCQSTGPAAARYTTLAERDTRAAQRSNDRGLKAIEAADFVAAERHFREALAADVFYPAAHNNLGLVLLHGGKVYESAWEFQYAAKLQPKSAEPRHNLGTLMEHVGRLEDAEQCYTEALALDPENIEIMGHLARVYIKSQRRDATVRELLQKLATRADRGAWDQWAREWLMRLSDE